MALSQATKDKTGLNHLPERSDIDSLIGVGGTVTYGSKVTIIKTREPETDIEKAEAKLLQSSALTVEDNDIFQAFTTATGKGSNLILPTYNPVQVAALSHMNNTLLQAVSAMEINIDGTGYTIERKDGAEITEEDQKEVDDLKAFFDEPYPDESFITMRRKLRRDIETIGNGYLEVIRNVTGEITFLNWLDAILTRMVKLDAAVTVEQTITRMGKETIVHLSVRERRFAQLIGKKMVYFKEFGASRKLSRKTGEWEGSDALKEKTGSDGVVQPDDEATEIIHFTAIKDILTNYGVPRWINQIPSILGSRRAEEYNLEFFNHGGLPPAMIMIQGGALSNDGRKALTDYMAGKAKFKQRGVIVEAFSTSGDLGSAGHVKVTVERFGAERQNDSMFEKYDERCSQRVRGAFRLPPLFMGLSQDHNFATAYVSYLVAEAQVFGPERQEFDEVINVKIMSELNPKYVFRSLPITVTDIEQQLAALEMAKDVSEPSRWIEQINQMANLELTGIKEDDSQVNAMRDQILTEMEEEVNDRKRLGSLGEDKEQQTTIGKSDIDIEGDAGLIKSISDDILTELAKDWAAYLSGDHRFEDESIATMRTLIKNLSPTVQKIFKGYVGMVLTQEEGLDPEETANLITEAGLMEKGLHGLRQKRKNKKG